MRPCSIQPSPPAAPAKKQIPASNSPPGAVAIVRGDRLGDVILSSMIPPYVRRFWPGVAVNFWVQPPWLPLFGEEAASGLVKALPTRPSGSGICPMTLAKMWQTEKIGTVVLLEPDATIEEAARMAGIAVRVGFSRNRRHHLTHALPYTKKKGLKHESDYAFDLLALIGLPRPATRLEPLISPPSEASLSLQAFLRAQRLPPRLAVMHTGAHTGKPRIPADYFIAVARALNEKKHPIALVGTEPDSELTRMLAELTPPIPVHDLGGKLSLDELAYLLKEASVFFSRDTGPAHLAAAMGCPTMVLFAQPSPGMDSRRWRPLGPRVTVMEKPLQPRLWENRFTLARRHFALIPPDEVAQTVARAVGSP